MQLLNCAKQILINSKKETLSFSELWKSICKDQKINANDALDLSVDFYQDLLDSPEFFNSGDQQWGLRSNIKFEKYQELANSFNSNLLDDLKEKDYKVDMSINEIKELDALTKGNLTKLLNLESGEDTDEEENTDLENEQEN